MTQSKCNECHQRAVQGPHYDAARRSGRTSRTLNRALLAAVAGHRVLHVASTEEMAKEHCRTVQALLKEAGVPFEAHGQRLVIGGAWIEFKGMHSDLEYRGFRHHEKPSQVWWDHYAEELREIARLKAEKAAAFEADMQAVKAIMMKHDLYKVVFNATAACGTHRITK